MRDVAADEFVVAFAAHLKKAGNLPVPKWTTFCKTATQKELAPYDADWYYVRTGAFSLISSAALPQLCFPASPRPRRSLRGSGRAWVGLKCACCARTMLVGCFQFSREFWPDQGAFSRVKLVPPYPAVPGCSLHFSPYFLGQ